MLRLLAALAGLALAICIITAARFWASAWGTPHLEHIRRASGGRPWAWALHEMLSCLASLGVSLVLYPAFLVQSLWLPRPGPKASGPPVLLTHGLFHTSSAWFFYARWLPRAGFTRLHAWTYNSFTLDFDGVVEGLSRQVEALRERYPGQKVLLVGHSLGGLAIRAYLSRPGAAERATAAVSLAAPHQGSKLASLGFCPLARSLLCASPLYLRLNGAEVPAPVPALSIYTPVDNMVIPNDFARISVPGWTELETAPVSHVWLLYHRPAAMAAIRFLQDACADKDR
jgi:triacylglycerol lipase